MKLSSCKLYHQTFPFVHDPSFPHPLTHRLRHQHLAKSKTLQTNGALHGLTPFSALQQRGRQVISHEHGTGLLKRPREHRPPSKVATGTNHPTVFHLLVKTTADSFPQKEPAHVTNTNNTHTCSAEKSFMVPIVLWTKYKSLRMHTGLHELAPVASTPPHTRLPIALHIQHLE